MVTNKTQRPVRNSSTILSRLITDAVENAAVLFPAFSTASVINRERMVELFRTGLWVLFVTIYPIAFVVVTFAPELLRFWLGNAFALQSTDALRWLAVGV